MVMVMVMVFMGHVVVSKKTWAGKERHGAPGVFTKSPPPRPNKLEPVKKSSSTPTRQLGPKL